MVTPAAAASGGQQAGGVLGVRTYGGAHPPLARHLSEPITRLQHPSAPVTAAAAQKAAAPAAGEGAAEAAANSLTPAPASAPAPPPAAGTALEGPGDAEVAAAEQLLEEPAALAPEPSLDGPLVPHAAVTEGANALGGPLGSAASHAGEWLVSSARLPDGGGRSAVYGLQRARGGRQH
jgi:hypothetical protein